MPKISGLNHVDGYPLEIAIRDWADPGCEAASKDNYLTISDPGAALMAGLDAHQLATNQGNS